RRFARLSSHHQAEYRYGGGIPACLVKWREHLKSGKLTVIFVEARSRPIGNISQISAQNSPDTCILWLIDRTR
ncbi:hypothetical protein QUA35_20805, partial [Microcoleus sp. N9_B2]